MLILKTLTTKCYGGKESFAFAKKIVEQDSDIFMANLDIAFLYTNLLLKQTSTNVLYEILSV